MAFDDVEDDIGADVLAAFRGEEPPAREPAAATPGPNAVEPPAPAQATTTQAARDTTGRFAPKGEAQQPAAPAPQGAPAAAAAVQGAAEAVRPPASWSAQAKADFASLAPHIQQEVLKRETDIESGRRGFEAKAQVANQFEELFASRKDKLAMAGMNPVQATQRLLAAQDILDRDPRAGLLALAQAYGIHPSQLVQATGQQQPAPQQAQLHPALQALARDVETLKGSLTQQTQAQAVAEQQRHAETIQQFAADPKNLYFENVRSDMAALLAAGQAKDMADAYEKATWAHPEIRPLLLKQQQAEAQAAAQASAGAKVRQARSAAGSVTGSPSPGSSPAQQSNPNASIEDDVKAAFAAHGARA